MEIPLFPLRLVLFPRINISLHIFEPRYKAMVERCLSEDIPFGIVLVEGVRGNGEVVTRKIGCTARILSTERLADGNLHIEVAGETRFRLLDTHDAMPYRSGVVEAIADDPCQPTKVLPLADQVEKLMREFLTRMLALQGNAGGQFDLPDDPVVLSFLASCLLPIGHLEQQALLETTDTETRLQETRRVLQQEVLRLRREVETQQPAAWKSLLTTHFDPYRCAS
jgi:Lon protease-like protein